MNYTKLYKWNPLLPPLNEVSSYCSVGEAAPAGGDSGGGGGAPPGGTPAPAGGDVGSGDNAGSGAGDAGGGSDTSFEGLDNDFDSIDLGDVGGGDTPPATPQAPPAAATPSVAQQPPPAAAQTPPAQQPQATPQAAPTPSAPRSAREELDGAVEGFKKNFNDLVQWGQTELFSLSQAEIDELDTNATAAIPKLMARCYTQAVMASANIFRNFASRMIEEGFTAQSERTAKSSEAKAAFYAAYPNLDPKVHDATVAQFAKAYRQMNPKATRDQAIQFVGSAVLAHFGLQRAAPGAQPQGGVAGRTPPFQPALPGGRAPVTAPTEGAYDGLDVDYLDSE